MHILLVDDEIHFSQLTLEYLEAKGCTVTLFHNGFDALAAFKKHPFDICVLDVKMPLKDGFTLASEIRTIAPLIPVIFLTGATQKEERIKGLSLGADDYITKPFSFEELYLRIQNIMRRVERQQALQTPAPNAFHIGQYHFNPQARTLAFIGKEIKLTAIESKLLLHFLKSDGFFIKRDTALQDIWGDEDLLKGRSLNVYVSKLRQHLADDPHIEILNVHGEGYQLVVRAT